MTGKDADVDRLTRQDLLEECRRYISDVRGAFTDDEQLALAEGFRDLALQSLSQEAVRDEALELGLLEWLKNLGDSLNHAQTLIGNDDYQMREALRYAHRCFGKSLSVASTLAVKARVLKREPNAAAVEGPAHGLPCWPVDRPAPAVVELIAQLHDMAFALEKQGSEHWAMNCGYAAALLAKLGQGWVHPVAVVPDGYVYIAAGAKGVYTHTEKSDWFYTYTLPQPPGASDE